MSIGFPASLKVTVPLILLGFAAVLSAVNLLYHVPRAEEAAEESSRERLVQELARSEEARTLLDQHAEDLKRSNAELEQFAYVASHDLQTPLRQVQAFGDRLERRFGGELSPDAHEYVERMRAAAARMSSLIEDLLRFSRVTTQARPAEPVDLGDVARAVTSDLGAQRAETGGTVEIGALPTVMVEREPTEGLPFRSRSVSPCRCKILLAGMPSLAPISLG